MVIGGMVTGEMFFEIRNLAKMLPIRRHLMALSRRGLFLLIRTIAGGEVVLVV